MSRPPCGFTGSSTVETTSCPAASAARAASSATVRPVTVAAPPSSSPAPSSRAASSRTPPAACMSVATKRPHGFMSAITGVRALMRSKSSRSSSTPASRATASRCSTALVDPPVATARVTPLVMDARVRICRAVTPRRTRSTARRPQSRATPALAGSVAGTEPLPIGEMPIASKTVAMVLAVNCPPHEPAPGHAARSSSSRSSSLMRPAAHAPIPSNTSWMVTSRPR